ncbi:MAG: DNA mismatch repair endonuclease MutL [Chthoniobacterales bacterium]|nr:DNA mismatch repair endonuclease MutL [Chthoniobacterales bacterium]
MGKIRVLPEVVASQVAAGEVVERPASVLKELLENSLDAGARQIEVEVRGAGTALVRVTDNGSGMDREDALMALERHATSKIATAADLASVQMMGFRGEAVPSIASVSEFTLRTRTEGASAGTEAVVRGGKLVAVRDAGCPVGTTIEVKSLFFNVPARKKFLRSHATESAHLDRAVENIALAFPSVALAYVREGREIYRLPSAPLAARTGDLFGAEDRAQFLEIAHFERDGIRVNGLVSRPVVTRADRGRQFFFVNGRAVDSGFLAAGLREAYSQMLEPGRHPSVVLHLEIDPREMDCNVHPAKREVRFRRGSAVRDAVHEAVAAALREARAEWLRPVQTHIAARVARAPQVDPHSSRHQPELPRSPAAPPEIRPAEMVSPVVTSGPASSVPAERSAAAGEFRLIGPLGPRYLLLEGEEGMVMLDRSAARQRILFERLQLGVDGGAVAAQRLLMPAVFELPPRLHEAVAENLAVLAASGFGIDLFGGNAVKVEAMPDFLAGRDPRRVVEDFAQDFLSDGAAKSRASLDDSVRRAVARLARGAPEPSDERAQHALVSQLLACELPYCDPDGKPVMLQFSWRELDRKFGRA